MAAWRNPDDDDVRFLFILSVGQYLIVRGPASANTRSGIRTSASDVIGDM